MHQLDLPALTSRSSGMVQGAQNMMHPRYVRALLSFIEGCQSILDVFLHATPETIRVLPILTIFRVPFAFKALAMLQRRMNDPKETLNLLIDDQTLAWDFYSDGVAKALETASADGLYAYPSMAMQIRKSMLASKKSEHARHNCHPSQTAGTATEPRTTPDLAMTDSTYGGQYDLLESLPLQFLQPAEDGAWPDDFLDFNFPGM